MAVSHPDLHDASGAQPSAIVTTVACFLAVGLATGATRAAPVLRLPPVLLQLTSGIVIRALLRTAIDVGALAVMSRPATDLCLALIGLLIGSHLNRETLSTLGPRMVWYLVAFFASIFFIVDVAASLLFPAFRAYAPFVAAIAMERSSPEALAGITHTMSAGPVSSATLLTSAVMDCAAIVTFVLCTAVLGDGTSAATTLGSMLAVTAIAATAAHGIVNFGGRFIGPIGGAIAAAVLLTALHRFVQYELLLAAIVAGAALNYRGPHVITPMLEENAAIVHIVLFGLCGLRIDVIGMAMHLSPFGVIGLFLARLTGLYVGSAAPAKAFGFAYPHHRCLCLVTQLAIALSLVTRMHDGFPEARPLADAAAGMVLLNLATGPALLVFALKATGEAGAAEIPDTPLDFTVGSRTVRIADTDR
jgi:hypothetical protein